MERYKLQGGHSVIIWKVYEWHQVMKFSTFCIFEFRFIVSDPSFSVHIFSWFVGVIGKEHV